MRASARTVFILLLLTDPIDDHYAIACAVRSWSARQRVQAADWAAALHYAASDNDDVKVPRMPGHVVITQKWSGSERPLPKGW